MEIHTEQAVAGLVPSGHETRERLRTLLGLFAFLAVSTLYLAAMTRRPVWLGPLGIGVSGLGFLLAISLGWTSLRQIVSITKVAEAGEVALASGLPRGAGTASVAELPQRAQETYEA